MGNCLVLQEKIIKVMKTDGKILEYKAPIKAHQVLSDFSGHTISHTLPVVRHLQPDSELIGGHLYYLLPLPPPPPAAEKKRVRFADLEKEGGEGSGVVRIKLVITKQELEVMLRKGGVSVDDLVSHLSEKKEKSGESNEFDDDGSGRCKGWKPVLESIVEVN